MIFYAGKYEADAKAYSAELNGDKAEAVARCKELIVLREGEGQVKFLDEKGLITFEVLGVVIK